MSPVKLGEALEHLNDQVDGTKGANAAGAEGVARLSPNHAVDRDAAKHPAPEPTTPVAPLDLATGEITIVMTDGSRRLGRVVWSTER